MTRMDILDSQPQFDLYAFVCALVLLENLTKRVWETNLIESSSEFSLVTEDEEFDEIEIISG
ncbi:gp4 [Sclerotinia sclerotiorum negative-stranded RNA virus 3-A]|nr:gp4 [Sclerotinia sclerotiorum negative-stranded RNA virus 3-A]